MLLPPTRGEPLGRILLGTLVLISVLGVTTGCSFDSGAALHTPSAPASSAQSTVPDVVGERGDIAQDTLQELGLTVVLKADDSSVWAPQNWVVEAQEPAAGQTTTPGASVTLHLVRPAPLPWAGPATGTWAAQEGVPLGSPVRGHETLAGTISSDYEFVVTGPPTLTTKDEGSTVTLTSPLTVKRTQNAWPAESFVEATRIFFIAGETPESERYDESYGVHTTLKCDADGPAMGETTTCTVSFTTVPSAIPDSYWRASNRDVAMWPGQD